MDRFDVIRFQALAKTAPPMLAAALARILGPSWQIEAGLFGELCEGSSNVMLELLAPSGCRLVGDQVDLVRQLVRCAAKVQPVHSFGPVASTLRVFKRQATKSYLHPVAASKDLVRTGANLWRFTRKEIGKREPWRRQHERLRTQLDSNVARSAAGHNPTSCASPPDHQLYHGIARKGPGALQSVR